MFNKKKTLARESSERAWEVLRRNSKLEAYLECVEDAVNNGSFKLTVDHTISEYDKRQLYKMGFHVSINMRDSEISWPSP